MILVPVKNLTSAKQRLATALDQTARTELAHAMLTDVLDAIAAFAGDDVSLVTSDPFALDLAKKFAFNIIRDDSNISETDAIEMATRVCEAHGIDSVLVVPGDIPLIDEGEIRSIYENAPANGAVLVPSRDKRGTNAVLRRPASLFPLRFGNDSFTPHLSAAIATDTSCVVLSLSGIGLDIDTPDDLHELAKITGAKESQVLARRHGFGEEQKSRLASPALGSGAIPLTAKP
ncbi:MAG TPA: 2-phospho-L-lactate guanylyltransferase [Terriglobales bacterium]|nr:2-phospho-L-lactate guanylyltransferase [Terriglobales bacterium]